MLAKIEEVWWKNRELQLQRSDEVTLVLSSLHVSLRVIPTMIFIHFLTGKSSGILSTNCFEMSWWGSLEVKYFFIHAFYPNHFMHFHHFIHFIDFMHSLVRLIISFH